MKSYLLNMYNMIKLNDLKDKYSLQMKGETYKVITGYLKVKLTFCSGDVKTHLDPTSIIYCLDIQHAG